MKELTRRAAMWMIAASVAVLGASGSALAGEAAPPGSGAGCVISGDAYVAKDTTIYSEASAGNAIGVFSGARSPLKATNFPSDATTGRAQINTGAGFRLEGFADPRALTIFGARDLAVVPGHVWISAATPLQIVGASPGQLRVRHPAEAGLSRPLTASAICEALTFDQGTRPLYEIPKNARGYVAKQGSLDLYDEAGGSVVHTLHISGEGNGQLMWGTTMRGGYVHVTMRSSIYVDAWVKFADVRALPRGELMDQVVPPSRVQSPASLALKEFVSEMQAPKQISLYYGRGETNPTIGVLEQGAEIYVLETVVGWATVLPKKLHVLPHSDRAFWVKAADLGLASPAPADKK